MAVYQHALQNIAIVAYDPALIESTPVQAAKLCATPLVQGDEVYMVGLAKNQRLGTSEPTRGRGWGWAKPTKGLG